MSAFKRDLAMSAPDVGVGLIGDIGATNARFALVLPGGRTVQPRVCALDDYSSLTDAIDAYLIEQSPVARPIEAVLAIASPVTGDEITLTNHAWTFSIEGLRRHFGLRRLRVINDFAANAAAIPYLGEDDRIQIGDGVPVSDAPVGIIGPGTGLGVGALAPGFGGAVNIAAEGGHVTMTPATAQESVILDLMRARYDHVSAERLLSGPGLVNLYNTLCELAGTPAASYTPDQITSPRSWNSDPRTHEATALFCACLLYTSRCV